MLVLISVPRWSMAWLVDSKDHLCKEFEVEPSLHEETRLARIVSSRWSADSEGVVEQKLRDRAWYDGDLSRHLDKLLDAERVKVKMRSPR